MWSSVFVTLACSAAADPTAPVFPDRWMAQEVTKLTTSGRTTNLGPSTVYFGKIIKINFMCSVGAPCSWLVGGGECRTGRDLLPNSARTRGRGSNKGATRGHRN